MFLLMFLIAGERENSSIQITQNQLNIFMFQYLSGVQYACACLAYHDCLNYISMKRSIGVNVLLLKQE